MSSRLAAAFALALVLSASGFARGQALRLDEHEAIAMAVTSNPGLEGARIDAASAGWEVVGAEGQYPLTLGFSAVYNH